MVGLRRFELRYNGYEPLVLPLDDSPIGYPSRGRTRVSRAKTLRPTSRRWDNPLLN